MSLMKLGGYLAYTVEGYKCIAFGPESILGLIEDAESELDIPQSLGLRQGRSGFRRTSLQGKNGTSAIVYTAFIGLSEPNANRDGSFLAVGIATIEEIDCTLYDVGKTLEHLLCALNKRVSIGGRFKSNLSDDLFRDFLEQNIPAIESERKNLTVYDRSHASTQSESKKRILLSSGNTKITMVFNQICQHFSPQNDFYLFASSAAAELQGARLDFSIEDWPIKEAPKAETASKKEDRAGNDQKNALRQNENTGYAGLFEQYQQLSFIIKSLEVKFDGRLKTIGKSSVIWNCSLVIMTILLFFLFLLLLHSVNRIRVDIQKQLPASNQASGVPQSALSAESNVAEYGGENSYAVDIDKEMDIDEVIKKYCYSRVKNSDVKEIIERLNPNEFASKNASVEKGVMVTLPELCR